VSLESLLRASDFVTLHLRAAPATVGIIGARELSLMKPSAFLINTARASLVDRRALYDALHSGTIAGLGSDVIADGGLDRKLLRLPNVVGLRHLGNRCVEAVHEVMETAIDNAVAVLRGERPNYLVNPEVYGEQFR
jgi:phosphoglycerate dehydrogenase-like enzyme